jgi:hypothetical protein
MAKFPHTVIVKQSVSGNGDQLLEVGFLKRGGSYLETLMSSIDPRFGTKQFRVTAGALGALQEANDKINNALGSLADLVGKGQADSKRVSPMDAGMAVFLYTRKIEPSSLPDEEILLDEATVRGLLKKQFKGHF